MPSFPSHCPYVRGVHAGVCLVGDLRRAWQAGTSAEGRWWWLWSGASWDGLSSTFSSREHWWLGSLSWKEHPATCHGHFELYRYLVTFCIHVLQEWPSFLSIPGAGAAPDTHLGGTERTGVRPSAQSPLTRSGHAGSPCLLRCRRQQCRPQQHPEQQLRTTPKRRISLRAGPVGGRMFQRWLRCGALRGASGQASGPHPSGARNALWGQRGRT